MKGRIMEEQQIGLSHTSSFLITLLFPLASRIIPVKAARSLFTISGEKILEIVKDIPKEKQETPVTLQKIFGSEGQYNSWSVSMILKHLELVNEESGEIIEELAHGRMPDVEFLPENHYPAQRGTMKELESSLFVFTMRIKRCHQFTGTNTFQHPMLGRLSAKQWLIFSSLHQWLYLRQIQGIAQVLTAEKSEV
jgi:hypothetical protein